MNTRDLTRPLRGRLGAPARAASRGAHAVVGRLLFGVGARAYDLLTGQALWRAQVLRLLDHASPPAGPLRVLDLGTGPGVSAFALASALPDSVVTGVDLSARMIDRARAHHADTFPHLRDVDFLVADAAALPLASASFDLVTGHSFLYLLPDPVAALREARRVLRPGGVASFMEPARGGSLATAARAVVDPAGVVRADPLGAARFATSMALWRVVSAAHGRLDAARVAALFDAAGFPVVSTHPTLGGLGLHCVAVASNPA
ncbi:MAG: methyltransferase type 11 [Deltaproteobacteria bacterium HGW-Deltaproteobacteria-14]|jgi:ubiquinone/menaquinone biosynthesis C-methylase UbiE|nr:MAG: methyltransferase type 11 [Deltaproteobacteria bacterium HGW-Deltaproteobacteria-14]